MMCRFRLGVGSVVASMALTVLACERITGFADFTVEDGAAGTSGSGVGGVGGEGGNDVDACSEGLGTLDAPCCVPGALACAGHAQKVVLVCDAKTMTWAALHACPGQTLCDSGPGMNQGSCQPVVPICVGLNPSDKVCEGNVSVECGPDLVTSVETTCSFVCEAGECVAKCTPQERRCSGATPQVCDPLGKWHSEATCPYVCSGQGVCSGECTPGSRQCAGKVPQECDASGQWVSDTACPILCYLGACAENCTPGVKQCSGLVPQTCNASGQWDDGTACPYVCGEGVCTGVCVPGSKRCSGITPSNCDAEGQWQNGTKCVNQACLDGDCVGMCRPGDKQCLGNTLRTCQVDGQWDTGTTCDGATPVCSETQCTIQPSCEGLAATCGPSQNGDCCAWTLVPGGTHNRGNDPAYPAKVSTFRMDTYEVTVGRFRKFVEAGRGTQGSPPAEGTGQNPNLIESGWQSEWNTSLEANSAALKAGLMCHAKYGTWTDDAGDNESRPMNCLMWFEAFAFCIWDGGRLATEAEWSHAAAGGSEQREYPWSSPASSTSIDCTRASYDCANNPCGNGETGCQLTDIIVVGTKSAGNGRWGQADLGGNVWEWMLDWYATNYPTPCNDCARLTAFSTRVARGGGYNGDASNLLTSYRFDGIPTYRSRSRGARCVRSP